MPFQAEIAQLIAEAEARGDDAYQGMDWDKLSDAEEEVFAINRSEFPLLLVTLQLFKAFQGIIGAEDAGVTDAFIEAERAKFPEIYKPHTLYEEDFVNLAEAWCGIPRIKAEAIYAKDCWWEIRSRPIENVLDEAYERSLGDKTD